MNEERSEVKENWARGGGFFGPRHTLEEGPPGGTRAHTEEDGGVVGPESQSFLPRRHQLKPFSKWQESKQCPGLSHCPSEIPNPWLASLPRKAWGETMGLGVKGAGGTSQF